MRKKILLLLIITLLVGTLMILTGCSNENNEKDNIKSDKVVKYSSLNMEIDEASEFSEGLAVVKKDGKYGYIDKEGNLVIDFQYEYANPFSEGLAVVKKNGKNGYIDKSGNIVIDYQYSIAHPFYNGIAIVGDGLYYGGINNKKETVVEFKYFVGTTVASENLIKINTGSRNGVGFIKYDGTVVVEPKYEGAYNFYEGLAGAKLNGKWGFIDEKGNVVVDFKYDYIDSFTEDGLARVEIDDNVGDINTKGEVVIPLEYKGDNSYSDGLALIRKDGERYFIDTTGKIVLNVNEYESCFGFINGLASVKKNGKCGKIDTKGKLVIECQYDNIGYLSEDLIAVKKDGKWGYINSSGDIVIADIKNVNKANTSNNQTTDELKIGDKAIKYGTYTGIDGATGDILVINKDNTATLNGTNYTYKVEKYNFAQDSSSDSYKDAIIFLTNTGDTSFALYVSDNGSLNDDPMCYVYKDN